jgi:hypothetical protein
MENKQTAVDFLYEFVLLKLSNEEQMQFEGLFQQAKQMEKEQKFEFANKVLENVCSFTSFTGMAYLEKDIDDIYNETYDN